MLNEKQVNVARGTEVDIRWLKVDPTDFTQFYTIMNYNHGRSLDKIGAQEGRLFLSKSCHFPEFSFRDHEFFLTNCANFAY